ITAACGHVEEVEAPAPLDAPRLWWNRLAQLRKLAGAQPTVVAGAAVDGFAERLRAVAESFRPTIVQLEPHEMAQYLPALDGHPLRGRAAGDGRRPARRRAARASLLRRLPPPAERGRGAAPRALDLPGRPCEPSRRPARARRWRCDAGDARCGGGGDPASRPR